MAQVPLPPPPPSKVPGAEMDSKAAPARSKYHGRDFYAVFGVPRTAGIKEIQRAYRALALKVHPDRNGNSAEATRDFQELSRMIEILSDAGKRASYDRNGDPDNDNDDGSAGPDDLSRWIRVFQRVTEADIAAFSARYVATADEERDVLGAYIKSRGDMCDMLENIPLSDASQIPRYVQIVEKAIREKRAKPFAGFTDSCDRAAKEHSQYDDEAAEAEELTRQLAGDMGARSTSHPDRGAAPAPTAKSVLPRPFGPRPGPRPTSTRVDPIQETSDDEASDDDDGDTDNNQEAEDEAEVEAEDSKRSATKKTGVRGRSTALVAAPATALATLGLSMREREKRRHEAMVRSLEERYGGKEDSHQPLPTEEEFQKIQRRLLRTRKAGRSEKPDAVPRPRKRSRLNH